MSVGKSSVRAVGASALTDTHCLKLSWIRRSIWRFSHTSREGRFMISPPKSPPISSARLFSFLKVLELKWRRVPESNRCTRICNPLRHHSANSPFQVKSITCRGVRGVLTAFAGGVQRVGGKTGIQTGNPSEKRLYLYDAAGLVLWAVAAGDRMWHKPDQTREIWKERSDDRFRSPAPYDGGYADTAFGCDEVSHH